MELCISAFILNQGIPFRMPALLQLNSSYDQASLGCLTGRKPSDMTAGDSKIVHCPTPASHTACLANR